jgi:hypothetical protein
MGGEQNFMYVHGIARLDDGADLVVLQGLFDGDKPFFPDGMEIAPSAVGGHGARINSASIAIVELILKALPKPGTPAKVLYTYLKGCFLSNPGDIQYFQYGFDVDPKHLENHQKKMGDLVASLER